jgi:hypothetical protein
MPSTLKIEIETETEEEIYPLLQHVFREITEGQEYKGSTSGRFLFDKNNSWLVVDTNLLKGKYYWTKLE